VICPIENQENLELLLDYGRAPNHKGKVAPETAAAFGHHLEVCARCREALAGQQAVLSALDVWDAPEVSPSFDRRLYERIDRAPAWRERLTGTASNVVRLLLVWRGVPIAAAACLIVTAGIMIERREITPNPPGTQLDPAKAEQVVHELDDMDMLGNFDRSVRASANPEL
jgi:hypothetical protein